MICRKFRSRFSVILLAISLILLCLPASVPVFADKDDVGSITISCKTEHTCIAGMQWDLFLVAERNENYQELMAEFVQQSGEPYSFDSSVPQPNIYHTVGQFAGTHVMLNDMSDSAMEHAARTLENEAVVRRYTPDATVHSDENGRVYFGDMPQGLYLLIGKRMQLDDTTMVIPGSMLVEIISNSYLENLHVFSNPKLEYYTLSGEDTRMMVRKVWRNEPGQIRDKNTSVVVNIYQDGELYNTVTLSEANNWRMSWTGSKDCEWRVEEIAVPDEYTVIYQANETQYLIENTYTPWYDSSSTNDGWRHQETTSTSSPAGTTTRTETTTKDDQTVHTTDSDGNSGGTSGTGSGSGTGVGGSSAGGGGNNAGGGGNSAGGGGNSAGGGGNSAGGGALGGSGGTTKLPQTGQLWWPVPFLCLGGIVCIMIGWQLLRREEQG